MVEALAISLRYRNSTLAPTGWFMHAWSRIQTEWRTCSPCIACANNRYQAVFPSPARPGNEASADRDLQTTPHPIHAFVHVRESLGTRTSAWLPHDLWGVRICTCTLRVMLAVTLRAHSRI